MQYSKPYRKDTRPFIYNCKLCLDEVTIDVPTKAATRDTRNHARHCIITIGKGEVHFYGLTFLRLNRTMKFEIKAMKSTSALA
jgi:hypothetical protein